MIYTCNKCKFTFERIGEIDQCPDCGKKDIREASDSEKADYIAYQKERELSSKDEWNQ